MTEALKKLGGVWTKPLKGYALSSDCRAAVVKLLGGEELDDEDLPASAADPAPTTDANAILSLWKYKKSILVTGDTTSIKHQLGSAEKGGLGGSWNKGLRGWCFKGGDRARVLRVLGADPSNTITEEKAEYNPSKPPKKEEEDMVVKEKVVKEKKTKVVKEGKKKRKIESEDDSTDDDFGGGGGFGPDDDEALDAGNIIDGGRKRKVVDYEKVEEGDEDDDFE
jgi:hypothetical protein